MDYPCRSRVRALGLLIVALAACTENRGKPAAVEAAPTSVEVITVQEETLEEVRHLSGDVMPWEMLPLSFKVGGRVSKLYLNEGDEVKKGDLVAKLDPRDYELMRDLARAQVDAIEPPLKRLETLVQKDVLPPSGTDELNGRLNAAKIQKSQAEAALSYAWLRAPMSGVVIKRLVAEGDLVDPSRPVAVIADLRKVKVVLPVPQRDLPLFRNDASISITTSGVEKPFTGRVDNVGYAADAKSRTFPVTLAVENPDRSLRVGMIVEAEVPVATHRGIFVPLDAVSRDTQGQPRILVANARNGRAESRTVSTGALLGDQVLIERGLEPGAQVIIRGLVEPGEPVSTLRTEKRP